MISWRTSLAVAAAALMLVPGRHTTRARSVVRSSARQVRSGQPRPRVPGLLSRLDGPRAEAVPGRRLANFPVEIFYSRAIGKLTVGTISATYVAALEGSFANGLQALGLYEERYWDRRAAA